MKGKTLKKVGTIGAGLVISGYISDKVNQAIEKSKKRLSQRRANMAAKSMGVGEEIVYRTNNLNEFIGVTRFIGRHAIKNAKKIKPLMQVVRGGKSYIKDYATKGVKQAERVRKAKLASQKIGMGMKRTGADVADAVAIDQGAKAIIGGMEKGNKSPASIPNKRPEQPLDHPQDYQAASTRGAQTQYKPPQGRIDASTAAQIALQRSQMLNNKMDSSKITKKPKKPTLASETRKKRTTSEK